MPETDHESEAERLDRNWSELLQELRVTQTGIQVLTGFLLPGLVLVALTTCGVAFLVFDVVVGVVGGVLAAVAALVVFTGLWLVLPLRHPDPHEGVDVGAAPGRRE